MGRPVYEKLHVLQVLQIECAPEELQPGILYVSKRFETCLHLCACGCGALTVTPQHPTEGWFITGTDELVTLRPSIENPIPFCPNGAHYYITENRIDWFN
jgi:hypothetical protein